MEEDRYLTVARDAEAASRERSSKFLAYIYPVKSEEEIRQRLDALRKRYYDATHHCYAWGWGRAASSSARTTRASPRARQESRSWGSCSRPR